MGRRRERLTGGKGWSLVRTCPTCGRPESECRCAGSGATAGPPTIRLRLERRAGKAVTVLAAEGLEPEALRDLARELRAACAAGGGVKGLEATLQGDHRNRVRAFLAARAVRVRG